MMEGIFIKTIGDLKRQLENAPDDAEIQWGILTNASRGDEIGAWANYIDDTKVLISVSSVQELKKVELPDPDNADHWIFDECGS